MYKPGKEMATRLEYRSPDPACNPYLAFSVMLAAGLDGIENQYSLPDPVEMDIYKMSREQRKELGIRALPGSLVEAIQEVEKSQIVKNALGEHTFNKFVENRKLNESVQTACVEIRTGSISADIIGDSNDCSDRGSRIYRQRRRMEA